jgi:hypothetical protein
MSITSNRPLITVGKDLNKGISSTGTVARNIFQIKNK